MQLTVPAITRFFVEVAEVVDFEPSPISVGALDDEDLGCALREEVV